MIKFELNSKQAKRLKQLLEMHDDICKDEAVKYEAVVLKDGSKIKFNSGSPDHTLYIELTS